MDCKCKFVPRTRSVINRRCCRYCNCALMVIQSKWLFFCRSSCLCRRDCCVTRNCRRTWERTGNATWRRGTTLRRSGRRTATWWKNCSNPRRSLAVVLVPHTPVRGELLRVLCCIFNPRRLLYGWNHFTRTDPREQTSCTFRFTFTGAMFRSTRNNHRCDSSDSSESESKGFL